MERHFCPIKKMRTGHTVEDISQEDYERISQHLPYYDGMVRLYPGGWFFNSRFPEVIDKVFDFEFKPDDTMVITSPKSGTTWMQEIVWTLKFNPDLDNPAAKMSTDIRSPHIDADGILAPKSAPVVPETSLFYQHLLKLDPEAKDDPFKCFRFTKVSPSPRVIKSHLPLDLFPPSMINTVKVIYVARDPRDVIVSKYHFLQTLVMHSFKGTLSEFTDLFLKEEYYYHPYWLHIKSAYDLRDHPNFLYIYFEDLKADPTKYVTKISEFLGLKRTPEQIKNVVDYTNFKNMKQRNDEGITEKPMSTGGEMYSGSFFRKGKTGIWKEAFTPEDVNRITEWINRNMEIFPDDFKYKNTN